MHIRQGRSLQTDARTAVLEAAQDFGPGPYEILFAFCSTAQDSFELARALEERFPGTPVVGCTTSGEHLDGMHSNGGLVLSGLSQTDLAWSIAVVEDVSRFDSAHAASTVSELLAGVGSTLEDAEVEEHFCLSFVDGLRGCEEAFSAHLAEALAGISLIGGSAGDDLAFRETRVFVHGKVLTNAAALVLARGKRASFRILKHQHFTRTDRRLVVTKVDESGRRVLELDGRPAFTAYARALGMKPSEVDADVTFLHPVTFSCEGELYVRSVQQILPDGSMQFYCGVEEGTVLEVGGHHDMVETLERDFSRMHAGGGKFQLLLGFNCTLRALESKNRGQVEALGALWRSVAEHSIGFDTYGEQLDGLHINQTLLAIGLGSTAGDAS